MLIAAAPSAFSQAPAPVFDLSLKPVVERGEIIALEVTQRFAPAASDGPRVLTELSHTTLNLPTAARSVEILDARDERGRFEVTTRDVGEGAATKRQWLAPRDTRGRVLLRYRTPGATAFAPMGAAPPVELRVQDGAISGAGAMFLMRPTEGVYRFRAAWDLSALPSGSSAISSLDGQAEEAFPVATLDRAFFMAGAIGRHPRDGAASRFRSAWQGKPPFEAEPLMAWSERLREYFITFFRTQPTQYAILMRPNPVNPGGGVGLHRSFVATFGPDTDADDLRLTLSHEMFHTFQPMMRPEEGASQLSVSWFNEGLATFYQRELPLRSGQLGAELYLRDLNYHAGRYYTNVFANLPTADVAGGFWRDTRVRTLAYDRGFLYFATVDEDIRRASGNRRSLDDLVVDLRNMQNDGRTLGAADWSSALRRELGEAAVTQWRNFLDGAIPLPSSDAFGPCFRRISAPLRRYELGFDPAVLTSSPRIVKGLAPNSAAESAGVRNGDEILQPVGQDRIQGDQEGELTLHLRRDGGDFTVSYRPRGETVQAWQWTRVASAPEANCSTRTLR
jgi:hypothetical protein